MSTKFKISVEIIDDNNASIEPVVIEKEIPSMRDFMRGAEYFRDNFDKYERAVLVARKEVIEIATEKYLEETSKKKSIHGKKNTKPSHQLK